jgi:hypothetical protein
MADLTGKTIANGYPNLVTIGATTNDNPTTGQLENGKGTAITGIGVNKTPTAGIELDVNGEIRASGGILFGSDTAAANTLDDYEEGTWTPVYEPQTGSFATMTMDVVGDATYTKIGRQVTVSCYIRTDDVDITGASGNLLIGGLPFTNGNTFYSITIGYLEDFTNAPDAGRIEGNVDKIQLMKSNATLLSQVGDLLTGTSANENRIALTATYFI